MKARSRKPFRPVDPDGGVVVHDSQGYPDREDFGVGRLVAELRKDPLVMEPVSPHSGPCRTATVWADAKDRGLTYGDRESRRIS